MFPLLFIRINSTVVYIGIGYVLLLVLLYFFQERFIFKPEKLDRNFKYKYNLPFKELFFETEPGVSINGLHFYCKNPNGLILYLHGNTRSIKGWAKYAMDFYKFNYDVVLIDYRGFGKSTGKQSEKSIVKDIQFVYKTLVREFKENHILVYGRSFGSGFATKIAAENSPRYLILDSPYYSFKRLVQRFLPFIPNSILLKYQIRTDKWIRKVNCHTYIIHGTKDWLIPIKHSELLQALNPRKITLIKIKGGGHNNLPSFPEYHNFLRDILLY